jgi:hypothetical protein
MRENLERTPIAPQNQELREFSSRPDKVIRITPLEYVKKEIGGNTEEETLEKVRELFLDLEKHGIPSDVEFTAGKEENIPTLYVIRRNSKNRWC